MERHKLPLHTQDVYNAFLLESANCTSANQHIYDKLSVMISWEMYLIWSKFARKSSPESMKVLTSPECLGHFTVLIKQTFPCCFMAASGAKNHTFYACMSAISLQPPARASPCCWQKAPPCLQLEPATAPTSAPAARKGQLLLSPVASDESSHLSFPEVENSSIDCYKPSSILQILRGVLSFSI